MSNKISTLALECFNKVDQEILDRYLHNKAGQQEIKKMLEERWWREYIREYFELCHFAKYNKLKLLAVDDRITFRPEIIRINKLYLEAHEQIFKEPFNDRVRERVNWLEKQLDRAMKREYDNRNRVIATTILKHEDQNIALVIGSMHVEEVSKTLRKRNCEVIPEILSTEEERKTREEDIERKLRERNHNT